MVQLLGTEILGDQLMPYKDSLAVGGRGTASKGSMGQKSHP